MTPAERQRLDQRIELELEAALSDSASSEAQYRSLRLASPTAQLAFSEQLLAPEKPEAAQRAAIDLVAWGSDASLSRMVIARFASMTPSLQADCLRGLVARRETLQSLAEAVEKQTILANQVPPDLRQQVLRGSDKELAARFRKLFTVVSPDRQAVIERYSAVLDDNPSSEALSAGKAAFSRVCAQCHRLGDIGQDVGPPLQQLADKSPQQLLEIILDPNREIDPKYASYSILLEDGRLLTGIIQDESSGQVVLKEAGGKQHVVARSEIEQIKNNGISLMPIGLEESLSQQQMSELIHFLKSTGR
jgi:putative heme-binding domain-containing protein